MKVVIAIDSFKGSMSSIEAGEAAAAGIRKHEEELFMEKNDKWSYGSSCYRDSNAGTWTYNGTGRREENIKGSNGVQLCTIQLDTAR